MSPSVSTVIHLTQSCSLTPLLFLGSFLVRHVCLVGKLQPLASADVVIVFGL